MSLPRRLPFAGVCLLWAGVVVGVAFAEAVKFQAPTLSRGVALDVGRTVFHASQWAQVGLLVLALGAALAGRVPRSAWACLLLVTAALVLQMVWVFPELAARAQAVLAGGMPPGPSRHTVYTLLEALKLFGLVAGAVVSAWPQTRIPSA
jgi:hypothetical protein